MSRPLFTDGGHAGLPEALLSPTKHPHLALEITTTILPYTMQINQPISASHLSFPLSIRDRLSPRTLVHLYVCPLTHHYPRNSIYPVLFLFFPRMTLILSVISLILALLFMSPTSTFLLSSHFIRYRLLVLSILVDTFFFYLI